MTRGLIARRFVTGLVAGTVGVVLAACGSDGTNGSDVEPGTEETPANAGEGPTEEPCAALDGEQVTMVIPYDPGGGFDSFVRLLEPHLKEALGGDIDVTSKNSPGGGGLIGANEIFQAEPDGTTIGLINYPGAVFAKATGADGAAFENDQWTFLARLGAISPLVYAGEDTPYTDFQVMIDSEDPIVFGIGGAGSDAYYATLIMSELLNFPADIVTGYPGGAEADAALLVGEVDVSVNSLDNALNRIEGTGTYKNVLISSEPNELVPDVPLITEFGDGEQQDALKALASIYDLERIMVAPPGMDEGVADCLAEAMYTAASSEGYIADMKSAGLTASALPREKVTTLAKAVDEQIDLLTPIVAEAETE